MWGKEGGGGGEGAWCRRDRTGAGKERGETAEAVHISGAGALRSHGSPRGTATSGAERAGAPGEGAAGAACLSDSTASRAPSFTAKQQLM